MSKLSRNASFFILIAISYIASPGIDAQYKITGQLNNYDSLWQNTISLSAINSTTQLYYASSDIIINKDSLDREGHFTVSGNSLPDENRIYRLDLTNDKNRVMIQTGPGSNYIFLILNNHSAIKINCNNFSRYSYNYTVEGSAENSALQKLEVYLDGLQGLFTNPNSKAGTGKEYAINRFNTNIRNYCDTCKYPIVALIAISEVIDFKKDYGEHPAFYKKFLDRIKPLAEPSSIYVKEFETKLNLLDYENKPVASNTGYLTSPLLWIEGIIILFLLGFIWYLKNKLKHAHKGIDKNNVLDKSTLFETLTRREKEILSLLIEEIQNKEIANKLNLEVSTIKTHIGKIYQKLAINNRNEVKAFEPFLKNKSETNV